MYALVPPQVPSGLTIGPEGTGVGTDIEVNTGVGVDAGTETGTEDETAIDDVAGGQVPKAG